MIILNPSLKLFFRVTYLLAKFILSLAIISAPAQVVQAALLLYEGITLKSNILTVELPERLWLPRVFLYFLFPVRKVSGEDKWYKMLS